MSGGGRGQRTRLLRDRQVLVLGGWAQAQLSFGKQTQVVGWADALTVKHFLQPGDLLLDDWGRREHVGPGEGVEGVLELIAGLVEDAEIAPHLANTGIEADGLGVGIEGVAVLVGLKVERADGVPVVGVGAIAGDGILESVVGVAVLLQDHVGATQDVPGVSIGRVGFNGQYQKADGLVLVFDGFGRVVEPTQLLEDFWVAWGFLEGAFVDFFGHGVLAGCFVDHANLEVDVGGTQRFWRTSENDREGSECKIVLPLLFVQQTQTIIDVGSAMEIGVDLENRLVGFFSVVQRAEAIIEGADAKPQVGVFGVVDIVEGLLVGVVGLFGFVEHQIAMAQTCPAGAVGGVHAHQFAVQFSGHVEIVGGLVGGRHLQ